MYQAILAKTEAPRLEAKALPAIVSTRSKDGQND